MSSTLNAPSIGTVRRGFAAVCASVSMLALPSVVVAQSHDHSAQQAGAGMPGSSNEALHMEMSPTRAGNAADSARAASVAATLRRAIAKYRDTTEAVKDGFRLFAPQIRNQKVYHFSSNWMGVQEAFRFDPAKPTSLLYKKKPDGNFELIGAMYVTPKRFTLEQLDARVPLSVAHWHKHVNWCFPPRGQPARWLERKDGHAIFGPDSPIDSRAECDAVGGTFRDSIFGWMVHANVFAGDDPRAVWGDEHAAHDMHDGMKMEGAGG